MQHIRRDVAVGTAEARACDTSAGKLVIGEAKYVSVSASELTPRSLVPLPGKVEGGLTASRGRSRAASLSCRFCGGACAGITEGATVGGMSKIAAASVGGGISADVLVAAGIGKYT